MTTRELHELVDRINRVVLDDQEMSAVTYGDLQAMTRVVIELTKSLGAVTQEWIRRQRQEMNL